MTPTEDDLRDALRLLDQRAPDQAPDVHTRATRSRWPVVARIGAAAAAVLVIAGGAALLGLHHDGTEPAQSAPTVSIATPPTPSSASPATLHVRVALFGGPARPNGKPYAENRPQPGAKVVVTSVASGHGAYRSHLRVSSTTNRHGVATFMVPPGRYRYRWDEFRGDEPVSLTAGDVADVHIDVVVP